MTDTPNADDASAVETHAPVPGRLSTVEVHQAMRALATGELAHRNTGTCPKDADDETRDPQCAVCNLLERIDLPFEGPESAEILHSYASHFAPRDWQWTRKSDIEAIYFTADRRGYRSPTNRFKRAIRYAFGRDRSNLAAMFADPDASPLARAWENVLTRGHMARRALERERHVPDGHLENAGVIAFWEEDGEYLQYVQPTVGVLLAEFLAAEPEHPHAVTISAELDRIRHGYAQRIRDGLVDGRRRTSDKET